MAAVGTSAAQDEASALIARIEAPQTPDRQGLDGLSLEEVLKRFHVAGMSVAVIKDFRIHWAKGYGLADVETGRKVEPGTAFQAASISKPVTAMAALRLAQEGRLSLDADVTAILKSWRVPETELTRGHPVTPRSLFSHTSGADDGLRFPRLRSLARTGRPWSRSSTGARLPIPAPSPSPGLPSRRTNTRAADSPSCNWR